MKQLDSDFRDAVTAMVDTDGNVVVGGIAFTPLEVLESDEDSYREAFLAWRDEEWIPLREDRLSEILKDKANEQRFQELNRAVAAGRVVPFIGSGLSAASGMPLWSSFLRELRKSSTLPELELETLLLAGDFEDAASALLSKMPNHLFDERLEQTFLARSEAHISGAVRFIPEIFNETVVTTNFDNVLEVVQRMADASFSQVLYGASIAEFRVLRARGDRCLLKLHGDHTRPASRVLTRREYDAAYGIGCPARAELEHVFSSESLLFLGCSLEADRTMELLQTIVAADAHTPRNYALMQRPSIDTTRLDREHFLAERKVFPIWYDGTHDECIEALFYGLLRDTGKM